MAVQETIPVRYRAFGVDLVARYIVGYFIHALRATVLFAAFLLLAPQLGFTWIGLFVAVIAIRLILTPFDPDGHRLKTHAKDQWRAVAKAEKRELKRLARLRKQIQRAQRRARNEAGVV